MRSIIGGQLFDAAGTKVGGEFLVNTNTLGFQGSSSVAVLSGGGFVVTWFSRDPAPGAAGPCDPMGQWHLHIITLDPAWSQVHVSFGFDSSDGFSNDFPGWFIDDVVVTGSSVCAPDNDPPVVTINSPTDGTTVAEGTDVSFSGTAADPEDGDLSANLSWESNLDGVIGTGGSFATAQVPGPARG